MIIIKENSKIIIRVMLISVSVSAFGALIKDTKIKKIA
jgi:hypothetical protein